MERDVKAWWEEYVKRNKTPYILWEGDVKKMAELVAQDANAVKAFLEGAEQENSQPKVMTFSVGLKFIHQLLCHMKKHQVGVDGDIVLVLMGHNLQAYELETYLRETKVLSFFFKGDVPTLYNKCKFSNQEEAFEVWKRYLHPEWISEGRQLSHKVGECCLCLDDMEIKQGEGTHTFIDLICCGKRVHRECYLNAIFSQISTDATKAALIHEKRLPCPICTQVISKTEKQVQVSPQ